MLQRRKPDLSKEDWFPVLEAMHFELFICEREGANPREEIRTRRAERVIAILTDPRLEGCFMSADAEELRKLPYPKLRKLAMLLRVIIQDSWLWGRNWEMVMRCKDKHPRWKTYGSKRPNKALAKRGEKIPQKAVQLGMEFERVLSKLDLFVGFGNQIAVPGINLLILCDEVRAILRDRQFRSCYWYRSYVVSDYDELRLVADQARGTIRAYLERSSKDARKKQTKTKGGRNAGKRKVAKPATDRKAGAFADAIPAPRADGGSWPFPRD